MKIIDSLVRLFTNDQALIYLYVECGERVEWGRVLNTRNPPV